MHNQIISISILRDNYVWTIINTEHHVALVVDPGDADPIIAYLTQHHLTLNGILVTHHHWDHTNGVAKLKAEFDVPVFTHGDQITINNHFPTYRVLTIPGHTQDHVAYYGDNSLFCGDTLFAAGCGRLFEGTASEMYQSLQKLAQLPKETRIYCGHEYTLKNLMFAQMIEPNNQHIAARIKKVQELRNQNQPSLPSLLSEELSTNPFLRCDQVDVIAYVEKQLGERVNDPITVFKVLRQMKDQF